MTSIFLSIIIYYSVSKPIKLVTTTFISNKDGISYPHMGYFYYGIYNSGKFNINIKKIDFNTNEINIKEIGIRNKDVETNKEFALINGENKFILNKNKEADIRLIAEIKNRNSEMKFMKIEYEMFGINFKQVFYINIFSE